MKYLEIKTKLKNQPIFSTKDLLLIDNNFNLNNLTNWINKGYIIALRKNWYLFSDTPKSDALLMLIANQIYAPAYISLETAFSYYHLIPETVYTVTSVTARKTNKYTNQIGTFTYRTIKPELFWGYIETGSENSTWQIAEPEKALLDYLYLNTELATAADFYELRFNFTEFTKIYSPQKLTEYLQLFNSISLSERLTKFLAFYQNA